MGRRILSAVVAICCGAALAQAQVKVGDHPSLSFQAVGTKEQINLANYGGKLVLIDFWATWCGPCMGEAAHMVAIHDKYSAQGLEIIGISLDQDINGMQQVAAAKGFTWPQYCDTRAWDSPMAAQFGVQGIPCTFLVGPDGAVLWTGHPAMLDGVLEQAFRDHPPVLVDPRTAAEASADLDAVEKALTAGDFPAAAQSWARIPADIDKDKKLAARQDEVRKKLDDACAKVLANVETLVQQKQYRQAIAQLKDIQAKLTGLPAAAKAHDRFLALSADPDIRRQIQAADRTDHAAAALAAAEKLKDDHRDEQAYAHFKAIVIDFPGTPAAATAAADIAAYDQSNPSLAQQVAGSANDARAKAALGMAQAYKNAGNTELARKKYQDVIQQFPGTSWAETAQRELGALQ